MRDIKKGEELLINYDNDENINKEEYPWLDNEYNSSTYKP